MIRSVPSYIALLAALIAFAASAGATAPAGPTPLSLAEYRARLEALDHLVAVCRQEVNPVNCNGDSVGPDVQVALPSGSRQIRFGWLHVVLDQVAKPQAKKTADSESDGDSDSGAAAKQAAGSQPGKPGSAKPDRAAKPPAPVDEKPPVLVVNALPKYVPPTPAERLDAARERLREDWERAGAIAGMPAGSMPGQAGGRPARQEPNQANASGNPGQNQVHHQALTRILSAKEYQTAVRGRSLRDRILEKIANWVNQAFIKLSSVGSKSKWIGRVFEIGFILLLCIFLVWFLIRLERQGRLNAGLFRPEPGGDAVSARDWQLWLQDAKQAAASGAWRDAIHLLYWASISRLESSGEWPADRARTPREYLALLAQESQQRPALTALTRSFERTWYAGCSAAEADFLQAEQQAARLGAR